MLILLICLGLALCAYAALHDVATLLIPNWLNLSLATLGVVALLTAGLGMEVFLLHIGVALAALAISFVMFMVGVWGGGDAKMVPAVLLWLGPVGVMPFIVWMAVSGGILAVVLLLARKFVPARRAPSWLEKSLDPKAGAPYGVAIAVGMFMAVPASPLFASFVNVFPGFH